MAARDRSSEELEAYLWLRELWRDDPERYARDRLGQRPTWQQRKIYEAIADHGAKVTVRSGHGIGKSGAAAGAILWFLETRDFPKVPCTAPTAHQLKDVLWAEIAKWIRNADALSRARGDSPLFGLGNLFSVTNDRVYDPSAKGEWFAVARTSGRDNPDALQGFHATEITISDDGQSVDESADGGHIMFVIDEASGVYNDVFEVAEGALSSSGARLLMLGNPTRSIGYFADSHRRNRGEFTALHFRTSDSPLADPEYRERLVRKWGEGSNIVRVRADGEFPKQDDDALISFESCLACVERAPYGERCEVRIGVDPARFGDDRTVLIARRGRDILEVLIRPKQDTMVTVGDAINLRKKHQAKGIWVGATGFQGIVDRLAEQGENVIEVVEGASAPAIGEEPEDMQPKLVRDFIWYEGMKWIRDEAPSFGAIDRDIADDLAVELSSVRYSFDSSGRMKVEGKDEIKKPKRLGRSPDIADAVLVTFMPEETGQAPAVAGGRVF